MWDTLYLGLLPKYRHSVQVRLCGRGTSRHFSQKTTLVKAGEKELHGYDELVSDGGYFGDLNFE
jgi:hypothetical protein